MKKIRIDSDAHPGPTVKLTAKEAIEATFRHYDIEVPPQIVTDLHRIMVATHNAEATRQLDEAKADLRACQKELASAMIRAGARR